MGWIAPSHRSARRELERNRHQSVCVPFLFTLYPSNLNPRSPLPTPRQTPVDSTPLDRRPTGRPVPSSQLPSQSHPTPSHVSAPSPSPSPADTKPSPLPPPPPQNDPPLVPQTPTNTVPCLPANLAATFMDVLKHQHQNGLVPNLPGWPGSITNQLLSQAFVPPVPQPTSFGTTFTNLFPSMTQSTPPQSFGHILPPPATPMTLPSHKNRRSPTPNSTILTPSLKRRSPHFDSSPALPSDLSRALLSSQSKGKERMSDGSPRPTKQVRLNKEPHFMYESPPPSSQLSTSSVHRDVFTDDEGKALCFVVQIDLRNRKDVVAAIKVRMSIYTGRGKLNQLSQRCGGRICSEISQADFVILTPQSTSFHDLLHSCKVHDKPAVHAQFVHDCVERNALLDEDSYGFGEVEKGKRGKGRPKQSMSYSGSNKQAPASKKKASTISHRKHEEPSPTQQKSRPRPRAPAPATNDGFDLPIPQASPMKNGKNLFTPEESQYFSLYLVHLFEKDPLISNSAISKSLQSKVDSLLHIFYPMWYSHVRFRCLNIRKGLGTPF